MFLGQGSCWRCCTRAHRPRPMVHTSLLEDVDKLDFQGARYTMNKEVPKQQGNFHPLQFRWHVSRRRARQPRASTGKMFVNFCRRWRDRAARESDYADGRGRVRNRAQLNADVSALTRQFTTASWSNGQSGGVPCGAITTSGRRSKTCRRATCA